MSVVPLAQTERIASETPEARFVLYEGANHTCANLSATVRPALADWMRDQLLGAAS